MHVLANALCALCGTFMLTKKTKNGAESELQYFFHPTTNEIGDSRAQFRLCFSDSHKIKVKGYRRWCFRAL